MSVDRETIMAAEFAGVTNNRQATPAVIAMEALMWLKQLLIIPHLANRTFAHHFTGKIGTKIEVKRPWKVRANDGRVLTNISPLVDYLTEITVDQRKNIAIMTADEDHTFNIVDFGDRYIKPAIHELATLYDQAGARALSDGIFHSTGTPGSALTLKDALNMATQATELHFPGGASEKSLLIAPNDLAQITESLTLLENPHDVGMSIRDLYKGKYGSWSVYESVHAPRLVCHATPAATSTHAPKIDSDQLTPATDDDANARENVPLVGDQITTKGWHAKAQKILNKGQLIKIAGVNQIEPNGERKSLGRLESFVVTADVFSDADGKATIPVYPPINDGTLTIPNPESGGLPISVSAFQNTDAPAVHNAVVTVVGVAGKQYQQYIGFHKMCLEYVPVQLAIPKSASWSSRQTDDQTGLSISYISDFNIQNAEETERLDTVFGVKAIYPEVGIRGISSEVGAGLS